ncbi:MAG: DUF2490 domain-containing protein [Kiritimatiellae bacterium]|nr:DUF2490 domain-containing protein [Kiritimatiellia bacterium]
MKRIIKYIALLFCALMATSSVASDDIQYWANFQFEKKLMERLKLKGEESLWYDDDRFFLTETIFLLEAEVFDWLSIAAGDRFCDERELEDGKMRWSYEHRPTAELIFKYEYEGFRFDWRCRFGYRDKEDTRKNYIRYRERFRVRTPWEWTEWKISPFASWEMYIEDKPGLGTGEMFNKSRSILGFTMEPYENVQVSLFYAVEHHRDEDTGWYPIHTPGIDIKYTF